MRHLAACALAVLTACADEPDFDTRYEQADAKIRSMAQDLENELEASDTPPANGPAQNAESQSNAQD